MALQYHHVCSERNRQQRDVRNAAFAWAGPVSVNALSSSAAAAHLTSTLTESPRKRCCTNTSRVDHGLAQDKRSLLASVPDAADLRRKTPESASTGRWTIS